MLYTQTLTQDDNYVRVGLLLKRIVNKRAGLIRKYIDTKQRDKAIELIRETTQEIELSTNKAHVVGQKEFKILSKIEYNVSRIMANVFHYEDTGDIWAVWRIYWYWYFGIELLTAKLFGMSK